MRWMLGVIGRRTVSGPSTAYAESDALEVQEPYLPALTEEQRLDRYRRASRLTC